MAQLSQPSLASVTPAVSSQHANLPQFTFNPTNNQIMMSLPLGLPSTLLQNPSELQAHPPAQGQATALQPPLRPEPPSPPPPAPPAVAHTSQAPSVQSTSRIPSLYQWPDGDVTWECSVGEEPAGWNDEGWKWRSSGSRKGAVPDGAHKVDKRVCLGVMHCEGCLRDGQPVRFFRPKTQKSARQKQLTTDCHICHLPLIHVVCDATLVQYQIDDQNGVERVVRCHSGKHSHPRPPVKALSSHDIEALNVQVRENPDATALQLRVGAGPRQTSLGSINPVLLDARKARHEVEKSKVRQGLQPPASSRNSGFQLLEAFSSIQKSFETPWIVKADLLDNRYITMQTPFMGEVLLRDSISSWQHEGLDAESARHGIITDGCHDYFKEGVLLSSVVFSQVLLRWVPVLYTWLGNLDIAHHSPHFDQLFYVIADVCCRVLGFAFDERYFSSIMDFSGSQRGGFIESFVTFMTSRIPGFMSLSPESRVLEVKQLRLRAEALIKGCWIHWKRSCHKIRQVISDTQSCRFDILISKLEHYQTSPEEFLAAAESI
ncbi:hypothetical protein JAAARDRAFT_190579 [Jaapia argillacea MUCL 33604]|uniref:GCM domain-containing protein n=1 Tax=Jaapia argillacea MUCL 33604 TaxID=933084 RepID=A0A067QGX5_9AGAM|nr:hypothetical protein JAAARDRAFT_190579 [Jaapia argillacea MUCL 33604]